MDSNPHTSVLLSEVLALFRDQSLRTFVDGTVGAGGHSLALLELHPELEQLVGIDQDPTALELAAGRLKEYDERVQLVRSNFSFLSEQLQNLELQSVDGILLDLGVSSMHLDRPERGFSFRQDGPLDMRMDPGAVLTAEDIVNSWSEKDLGRIFREYGEEPRWRAAARLLGKARSEKSLTRTGELVELLYPLLSYGHKKKIHPLTRVFQALRIAVNGELEVLEQVLPAAVDLLSPGGILAVISFHSLEDRMVKRFFQQAASDKEDTRGLAGLFIDKEPSVDLLTRKPLVASVEEQACNPRARSARLRAARKRNCLKT